MMDGKAAGTGQAGQAKTGPLFPTVRYGNGRPMLHVKRSNCMISGSRTVLWVMASILT